jgi:cytochrome c553
MALAVFGVVVLAGVALMPSGLVGVAVAAGTDSVRPQRVGRRVAAGQSSSPALVVDEPTKLYVAKPGEVQARFTFSVKNASKERVIITRVATSCACSVAKLPSDPWRLEAGTSGNLEIDVEFQGKFGDLTKTATIESSTGAVLLTMRLTIPMPAGVTDAAARERNRQLANVDRQAVFKGDCMTCHVRPGANLNGEKLYAAACGICHEAEHRAEMVPNIHLLPIATNRDYWLKIIRDGKPGTLMPAFGHEHGGPLTDVQIDSLAAFLTEAFSPHHPFKPVAPGAVPASNH